MQCQQLTTEMLQKRMNGDQLDLSSLRLTKIPIELICRCIGQKRIIHLDLSNNLLTSIPDRFSQFFPDIEELDLHSNRITKVTNEVGQLTSLRRLNLANNQIKRLPDDFVNLEMLHWLNLSGNPLDSDLAQVVGKCSNDAECAVAAEKAIQYIYFSSAISSESTVLMDDSRYLQNEELSASSSSSSAGNPTTSSEIGQIDRKKKNKESRRIIQQYNQENPARSAEECRRIIQQYNQENQLPALPAKERRRIVQQYIQGNQPTARSSSSFSYIAFVVFVFLCLVLIGVPIWLTLDSIRETCVSSTSTIARHSEELRFCAQLSQSILNGTSPSPFGRFLLDFAITFLNHCSRTVVEPLFKKSPNFHEVSKHILFMAKIAFSMFRHLVALAFDFLIFCFSDVWHSYVIPLVL